MRLAIMSDSLPTSWQARKYKAPQKRLTVQEKRAALDPHEIGLMRLNDMSISGLSDEDINRIGFCSIWRKRCVVGQVWAGVWCVVCESEYKPRGFRAFYVIRGKKVLKQKVSKAPLPPAPQKQVPDPFAKVFKDMRAGEIFEMCKGKPIRKRCKVSENRKVTVNRKTGQKVWGSMTKRAVCGMTDFI